MSCFFTAFPTLSSVERSTCSNGPDLSNSSLGCLLWPAAITFSPPCFLRNASVSSDPIWPVDPVTRIFFIVFLIIQFPGSYVLQARVKLSAYKNFRTSPAYTMINVVPTTLTNQRLFYVARTVYNMNNKSCNAQSHETRFYRQPDSWDGRQSRVKRDRQRLERGHQ